MAPCSRERAAILPVRSGESGPIGRSTPPDSSYSLDRAAANGDSSSYPIKVEAVGYKPLYDPENLKPKS